LSEAGGILAELRLSVARLKRTVEVVKSLRCLPPAPSTEEEHGPDFGTELADVGALPTKYTPL
jgi:hypothetical protein